MGLNPYHCAAGVESFPAEITRQIWEMLMPKEATFAKPLASLMT